MSKLFDDVYSAYTACTFLTYLLLVGRLPYDHPEDDEHEIARQTINDPLPITENKWKLASFL